MSALEGDNEEPDVERFRQLYDAHYPDIIAYAARRWPLRDEVADIAADVFLVAWRRLRDVPGGEEALLWLYGVARRVLANHARSRARRIRLLRRFEQLPAVLADVEAVSEGHADLRRLVGALHRLNDEDRELLLLAAWEQLTVQQIGRVLGCSANAASIRLHRARKRLTNVYKKENGASGNRPRDRSQTRQTADRGGSNDR